MKEVLEYSEEELRSLPLSDLKLLLSEAEDKESLYNTRQLVEKTLMNSLYGALANKWFPVFNERMAQAITGNGRFFIQLLANNIEKRLQNLIPSEEKYIIYGDTDSVYFTIKPFVEKYKETKPNETIDHYVDWCDNFEKKIIQPLIKDTIIEFSTKLNAYNVDVIGCDREIISDAAVFTAKKKYYARVRDNEGTRYSENDPYIKVMGLEVIKGGTPKFSKKYLKEAIPKILDLSEDELREWVRGVKQKYIAENPNNIAKIAGVNNLDYTWGEKGVPIGARSGLAHNRYITDNNLDNRYELIIPGDKTKRLHLIEPNKFESNVIGYVSENFAKELDGCIDYDMNFEKTFIAPLKLMVDSLGYDIEKETESLDDW